MRSRLFILAVVLTVGACMGLVERARAQEIGGDASSQSNFPAFGTTPSTNAASATPPAPPPRPPPAPALPPPLAPASALFMPVVPYGGGTSQTGEALAESMQQQAGNQPYTLKVGPVNLRADAEFNAEFNDNIGLSKNDRMADLILTPEANLHGHWDVSDLNTLAFNIGVGYQDYVFNSQFNDVFLSPDSEVSFNLFVGNCTINFHDQFSYEQDPTEVAQLSNQVRLSRFNNDAGVSAQWDLDTFMVEVDYDHSNLWVLQSFYDYLTNQSDTFAPTITWKVNETLSTGVNASFADTRYEQSFENDNTSESLGPFVKASISNFLSVSGAAGLFLTQYDQGGGNQDTNSNLTSWYANLGINHQISSALSESLTAGKQYLPGLTSNFTQRVYINYSDNWNPTPQMGVNFSLFWENLQDSAAAFSENSNRYGVSLGLSDALTNHLNVNVGYQFLLKDANPSFLSYYQNQGTLGMQYNF